MFIVVGVLLVSLSLQVQAEVHIGFTDVYYQESESEGCLKVTIARNGKLNKEIVISIHSMTYQQYTERGFTLPDRPRFQHLPNPAEYKDDFSSAVNKITLPSNLQQEESQMCIDINPDAIIEANEGFLLVLRIDNQQKSSDDVIIDVGVALGVILDDDELSVWFEKSSYIFPEGVGQLRSEIAIVRDPTVKTELNLPVLVSVYSTRGTATQGKDYTVDSSDSTTKVWFEPGIHRVVLPISIIEDNVPEIQEQFELAISALSNYPQVVIPADGDFAVVNIVDNDVVSVGFVEESYTCSEGEQEECQLCVSILSPNEIDAMLFISLQVTSAPVTTEAEDFAKLDEFLLLSNAAKTACFSVTIHNDDLVEGVESFQLVLSATSPSISPTLLLEQPIITVSILDDDMLSIGFEQQIYTCRENEPESCVLCVAILNPASVAEDIAIPLFATTYSSTATANKDYMNTKDRVILSKDSRRVCIVIYVWDDSVAEMEEIFQCVLSRNEKFNLKLNLPIATVVLDDDDIVSVGFDQEVYTCVGSKTCEVCISILSSTQLDNGLVASLSVTTIPMTAKADRDFVWKNDTVELSAVQRKACIQVFQIEDDREDQYFECILSQNVIPNSFSNVKLERDVATIKVQDTLDGPVMSCQGTVCHEKAICHDEVEGGVQCKCMDGYTGDGFTFCTDRNECAEGLDDCDHNTECITTAFGEEVCGSVASCANTDGSYLCMCNAGYTGDGRTCKAIEDSIDECREGAHTCHPHADCVDIHNGFLCKCRQGYQGDGFECTDVDECVSGVHDCATTKFCHYAYSTSGKLECIHIASCTNTEGGHTCQCNTGFTGDGTTCKDIDECEGVTKCSANAYCRNIPGSYHCKCKEGYKGDGIHCNDPEDACDTSNADCITSVQDIDECMISPCGLNADCMNTPGSYTCQCVDGYQGDGITCTRILIDECALDMHHCQQNSYCVDEENGYSCECNFGYRRDDVDGNVCIDIDECELGTDSCDKTEVCMGQSCERVGVCTNKNGSFQCSCRPGFTGNGHSCTDINECSLGSYTCGTNSHCVNVAGSYKCQCATGYEQHNEHICQDIDECKQQLHDCDAHAQCHNTLGGFQCRCNKGFIGNGTICHPATASDPCDEAKSKKGFAFWQACLKRQKLLRGNGHTAFLPSKSQKVQEGDEGSTDRETTGTHSPAKPGTKPQTVPRHKGERIVKNGVGHHLWQSKVAKTTGMHYLANSWGTPIHIDKYQEILDYWSTQGKQEPPQELQHHHQQKHHRHSHGNRNPHKHLPNIPTKGSHTVVGPKVHELTGKKQSGRKDPATKSHHSVGSKQDDEDVWFRVPGDMEVKISQHS